jgi:hypothetical protein
MSKPWSIKPLRDATAIPSVVVESWLGSYRCSPWAGAVTNNLFDAVYGDTIRQLFERGALCWIAHNPDDENHVIGYLVTEYTRDGKPVVHYCFVKDYARRNGVARSLFAAAGIDPNEHFFYTFRTPHARAFPGGRYEPAIARRKAA